MLPNKLFIVDPSKFSDKEVKDPTYCAFESQDGSIEGVEYIKKDSLMKWLEQELAQRRQWFERYEDAEDLHACNELTKIINKLDEM